MKFKEAVPLITSVIIGSLKYAFSWLMPKDPNIWVIGAWFGGSYSDNSKYLFEYILKNVTGINICWITDNETVLTFLKSQGKTVCLKKSWKGIWMICRAKVVIMTCSKRDIDEHLITNRSFNVQLWHGVGGNKKILYDTKERQYPPFMKLVRIIVPFLRNELNFDLLVSTSKLMQSRFSASFRLPVGKIPVLGYPRNDIFFQQSQDHKKLPKSNKSGYSILYAPTHRGQGSGKTKLLIPDAEELELLSDLLGQLDAHLTFKVHYYDYHLIPEMSYKNITFMRGGATDDVQIILLDTDLLIVDYSSIYFDYLLLNRPILFAPFDLKDYLENERELYERYEDITPGYVAENWKEVMVKIDDVLTNGDPHEKERLALRDKYWEFKDDNSAQRVYNEIIGRLKV